MNKRILSSLCAILALFHFGVTVAYACSPDRNYIPPSTTELYEEAKDVVLASIHSSNITKKDYEGAYRPNPEIVTVKIEKVYKGSRKVGDMFTYARTHGSGADCKPSPYFRHLGIKDENTGFYTSFTKPSILIFLDASFVDGSITGYSEKSTRSLSLSDMVVYSDNLLKDVSTVDAGLLTEVTTNTASATTSFVDEQRTTLMQQLIVFLNQLIQLLR